MRTVSFGIANYCAPCHAHCRYCLLSSPGKATGVDNRTGMAFADRVIREFRDQKPEFRCFYYTGYCMDLPDLPEYIRFSREHSSPASTFLQMNGFAFRTDAELRSLMSDIREGGVELIDLTFYGTEKYHDGFAGRKGDFTFLLRMLAAANEADLPVNVSIPLLRDNLDQMTALRQELWKYQTRKCLYFLPHSKGRGRLLADRRITREEFDRLPEEIRKQFTSIRHLTEAEWLASGEITEPEERILNLVLTPDNIGELSRMSAPELLQYLEDMDNRYLEQMPSVRELAERYGNPDNRQMFRLRDLMLKWQQQYIADTGNTIYDMHDETHHFTVHL